MGLGWEVFISRQVEGEETLAVYQAGFAGLKWLDELVKVGKAEDLGGNGYPMRYTAKASVIITSAHVLPSRTLYCLYWG